MRGLHLTGVALATVSILVMTILSPAAVIQGFPSAEDHETGIQCEAAGLLCERWTYRHPGVSNDSPAVKGRAVAATPDGKMLLAAGMTSGTEGHGDEYVVALDTATGAVQWASSWDGPESAMDFPAAIALSPDGQVAYVVSMVDAERGLPISDLPVLSTFMLANLQGGVVGLAAYDVATGDTLWRQRVDEDPGMIPMDLTVTPNGTILATGFGGGMRAMAFEAENGALRWSKLFDAGLNSGFGNAVVAGPDGVHAYLTGVGMITPPSGPSFFTAATLAIDMITGNVTWSVIGDHPESANDITIDPDGDRVYVAGAGRPDGGSLRALTWAFETADGDLAWQHVDPGTNGIEAQGFAIDVSADGSRVFRAAHGAGGETGTLTLLELAVLDAQSGDVVASDAFHRYPGAYHQPTDLVYDPVTDSVHVSGFISFPGADYAHFGDVSFTLTSPLGRAGMVVTWDASDAQLERAVVFERGLSDIVRSLTVGPDGDVYAAISSQAPATGRDFVVAAYPPVTMTP